MRSLLLLLFAAAGFGQTYVQGASSNCAGSPCTSSPITITAGHGVAVCVVDTESSGQHISLTDSVSDSIITKTQSFDNSQTFRSIQWFYIKNAIGGSTTFTATSNSGPPRIDILVREYSGQDQNDNGDVDNVGATGASGTATTQNFSTTSANEVVMACGMTVGGAAGLGAGYGNSLTSFSGLIMTEDQAFTSIQSGINATLVNGSNGAWNITAMSIKAVPSVCKGCTVISGKVTKT